MSQSLCRIPTHLIFSTKQRVPFITGEMIPEVHAYLAGILRGEKCTDVVIGGVSDHVHALFCLPKQERVSELVQTLKSHSTGWIKKRWPVLKEFAWQLGYAAYGVGARDEDAVVAYIQNQERHHRAKLFMEELLQLLNENRVKYDEKYLWD